MTTETENTKSFIEQCVEKNWKEGLSHGRFDTEKLRAMQLLGTRYVTQPGTFYGHLEHAMGVPPTSIIVQDSTYFPATQAQVELSWSGFTHLESNPQMLKEVKEQEDTQYAIFGMGTIAFRGDVLNLRELQECGNHYHMELTDGELNLLMGCAVSFLQEFALKGENLLVDVNRESLALEESAAGVIFELVIVRPVTQAFYVEVAKSKSLELVAASKYLQLIGAEVDVGCDVVDRSAFPDGIPVPAKPRTNLH